MRKEVKLGMAIGSALLAVLVVYLLVTPPNKNKGGAQLAGGSIIDNAGNGAQAVDNGAGVIDGGGKSLADAGPGASEGAAPAGAQDQVIAKGETGTDGGASERATGSDDWKKLLQTGKVAKPSGEKTASAKERSASAKEHDATMATITGKTGTAKHETATAAAPKHETASSAKRESVAQATLAAASEQGNLYYNPNDAWGGGVSTGAVFGTPAHATAKSSPHGLTAAAAAGASAARPEASPATPGAKTHVVQSGDTLSSIAEAVYGSANYYPHILRANPQVNPNNLKLGTVLNLPHVDEVKATATPAERGNGVVASIAPDVKIDSSRQYQVQSGDSLYKISLKLYGKSTYVERIYEKNKATIGSDPKKLKLGMILDLPEKTAVAAAAAGSSSGSGDSDEQDRK